MEYVRLPSGLRIISKELFKNCLKLRTVTGLRSCLLYTSALSEAQKAIDSASEFSNAKKADILFLADIKPEVIENADGTFTLTIPLTEKQMGYDLYYIGHKDEETGMFIWTAVTPKDVYKRQAIRPTPALWSQPKKQRPRILYLKKKRMKP